MSFILGSLIFGVAGFVFGVLFGRKNKKKVEAAVKEVDKKLANADAQFRNALQDIRQKLS